MLLLGISSTHSTPVKKSYKYSRNPDTSYPRHNPVQRSQSLAVSRPKITTPYKRERSNTPPYSRPPNRYQTDDWNTNTSAEFDQLNLPKSLFVTSQDSVKAKQLSLADILVDSAPERKEYEHQLRHSSDDILESSKYIREDKAIDSYVSLTGTRKKMKNRRGSDPFTGLLPGKSLSADQLDSQFDHGLRSRDESIEQLRGSHNDSESAFTSRVEQVNLPTPTSSEEELRGITGFKGRTVVKRSQSMTTGTYKGMSENSIPKQAKIKIISNNFSNSLDSKLESERVVTSKEKNQLIDSKKHRGYVSKYQEASPNTTLGYVLPKDDNVEGKLVRERIYKEGRKPLSKSATFHAQSTATHSLYPQPSTADPAAIRSAVIRELKSGQFNVKLTTEAAKEQTYSKMKKTAISPRKDTVSSVKGTKNIHTPSLIERGLKAARTGDLKTLKSYLLAEHIESPQSIDKRTAVRKTFHLYRDEATQSNLIHVTSEQGHSNCLKWLVLFAPEGACVALNKDRLVPAILAIRKGSLECVRILVLEAKVPLTIVELGSETLLHHAAFTGQPVILKWLLEHLKGKKANSLQSSDLQDMFGVTPVHFAAQQGYIDCLQVLQDAIYDILAPDNHNQTPLDWATAAEQDIAASYLFMIKSFQFTSEQLAIEKKQSIILEEKAANVENAYDKFKDEFEEQVSLIRDEYDVKMAQMKEEFLNISGQIIKDSKVNKQKRGVFRTFSMPAKQRGKKVNSKSEPSSPEEPRADAVTFPVEKEAAETNTTDANSAMDGSSTLTGPSQPEPLLPCIQEHKIDIIEENKEVVFQNTPVLEQEISPVTQNANNEFEFVSTLQKLNEGSKSNYRSSSPDPFSSQELGSTPDTTLQRRRRNIFGFKSSSRESSKTSLKEESVSRKSADSSYQARVGETTGCGINVGTTLRRIFSGSRSQEQTVHQNKEVLKTAEPPTSPPQKDQVTLETVQVPVSEIEIERDFIAESECSSHHSIPPPSRHARTAPLPPVHSDSSLTRRYDRKMSYINATSVEESNRQYLSQEVVPHSYYPFTYPQTNPFALATITTNPQQYARVQRVHSNQQLMQQQTDKHLSYPGVDAYGRQPDLLRPRSNQSARTGQTYSAPTPYIYTDIQGVRTASWAHPISRSSPQRSATVHVQNPSQLAEASRRQFAAKKSTTISDL